MRKPFIYFAAGMCVLSCFAGSWVRAEGNDKNLTPYQRVRSNAQKAQAYPALRGRWDREALGPASSAAYVSDNLAMRVLSDLNRDEGLSKTPLLLHVSSLNGVVTLEGVVNDPGEKDLVARKVGGMSGVKEVRNLLQIKTSDRDFLSRGV